MSTTYKQSPVSEEEKVLAIPRDLIDKTLLTAKNRSLTLPRLPFNRGRSGDPAPD